MQIKERLLQWQENIITCKMLQKKAQKDAFPERIWENDQKMEKRYIYSENENNKKE